MFSNVVDTPSPTRQTYFLEILLLFWTQNFTMLSKQSVTISHLNTASIYFASIMATT
jgi:hypothetical protein